MTATDSNPRHFAWFAPWTWKRRWIAAVVLLLLLAYPLSIGPAYYLFARGWLPWYVYNTVYLPIRVATQVGGGQILVRYILLFHPNDGTSP